MEAVNALAATTHGGILIAFALLFLNRARIPHVREVDLVRVFRACGAILGLSLGAFLFTELAIWPVHNPGATGVSAWAVHADRAGLRAATLFLYWVSYVALEIWTLEPCRLSDREGAVTDEARFSAAAAGVGRHLAINAILFGSVVASG